MKIIDYIHYSFLQTKRNLRYIFLLIITTGCFTIAISTLLISFSYQQHVKEMKETNPFFNVTGIDFTAEESSNNKEYTQEEKEKILNKIKKIDHVTGIYHQDYFNTGVMLDEETYAGLAIFPLVSGQILPSSSYKKDLKENEIIIPEKFYTIPYNTLEEDVSQLDYTDGKDLVGTTIDAHIDVFDCIKGEDVDKIDIPLKVVGTYDSNALGFTMDSVITSVETAKYISEHNKINITPAWESNELYYIQVDKLSNLNSVKAKIKLMGYNTENAPVFIMKEYYDTYVYTMYLISGSVILFLILIKYFFNKKLINDNIKVIYNNFAIGFKKKEIIIIETIKNYFIDFIALIFSIVFVYYGINYYNTNMESLVVQGYKVITPIPIFIFIIVFILLVNYIVNEIIIKNKTRRNVFSNSEV